MYSIIGAFFIDLLLGDPYDFPHPVRFVGKYISFYEKRVRKMEPSSNRLRVLGIGLTLSTVILTYTITFLVLYLCKRVNIYLFYIVNMIFLWTCIAPRCLQKEAMKIYVLLKEGKIIEARKQLSYIVGRDTEHLKEKEIGRAVVETVAENTSDGVIAPLFYMSLGGAPLAMAYKAINTLDSMVGYKEGIYLYFGWSSARLDDVANYIPARITALLMLLVCPLFKMDFKNCFKIIMRDRKNHASPNSAYSEAATAGALGVQLGGSNYYFGKLVEKPTIGDAIKELNKEHIIDAIKLMYGATILYLLIYIAVVLNL